MYFTTYKYLNISLQILGGINIIFLLVRFVAKLYAFDPNNMVIESLYNISNLFVGLFIGLTDIPILGAAKLDLGALLALFLSISMAYLGNKIINTLVTRRRLYNFSKKANTIVRGNRTSVIGINIHQLNFQRLEEKYQHLMERKSTRLALE